MSKGKPLRLAELVAIALGGMVGGGIFSIMGISVSLIGYLTPVAIACGGVLALLAGYSYVKLGVYYKDEGATYAFVKHSYPSSRFFAAVIGWYVIFGYISTLGLYAYTFASYALSEVHGSGLMWARKGIAIGIIGLFAFINSWSVKGMGKIEDVMVYLKLVLLAIISFVLIYSGWGNVPQVTEAFATDAGRSLHAEVVIVASLTFVAFEGFQLVINAVNEMTVPEKNIPRAIYIAIALAILIYLVLSGGALIAIPVADIIKDQEYALAAGAGHSIGKAGIALVVAGAVLATSSAISGTLFGASRQLAAVAADGYFPRFLAGRRQGIPVPAIIFMAAIASLLVALGGLQLLVEFGSVTFLVVCLLMSVINYRIRRQTNSSAAICLLSIAGLLLGVVCILYYEVRHRPDQFLFTLGAYVLLTAGAWIYTRRQARVAE